MPLDAPPLTDVPAHLRRLADAIEAGTALPAGGSVVLILDGKAGEFEVAAFGETDGALVASAIATAGVKLALERLKA